MFQTTNQIWFLACFVVTTWWTTWWCLWQWTRQWTIARWKRWPQRLRHWPDRFIRSLLRFDYRWLYIVIVQRNWASKGFQVDFQVWHIAIHQFMAAQGIMYSFLHLLYVLSRQPTLFAFNPLQKSTPCRAQHVVAMSYSTDQQFWDFEMLPNWSNWRYPYWANVPLYFLLCSNSR